MASKRTANDTVRMAPLTPVALGGMPRRRPLRMPEQQTPSMKARMERALENIMHRLAVAPAKADPR